MASEKQQTILGKKCCKCKEYKPLYKFHKDRSRKDGLQRRCKPCQITAVTKYSCSSYSSITDLEYELNDLDYEL